ncbi:MAG: endonuclease domain-containing protein [bacterium]|nr:endonuclease domain-containing protein [bacterium]
MRDLTPLDHTSRLNSPPLQGKGRGWGLSAERLAQLDGFAHDRRCDPTETEKRLWARLSHSQLAGHKFRRQSVIGPFIVDFFCPQKGLVIEVDGDTHDILADLKRDAALNRLDLTVLHVGHADVTRNLDGVCETILRTLDLMPDRWSSPPPNPTPAGGGRPHSQGTEF